MPPKKAPAKSAQKEVTASNHLFNVLGASSNELSYERSKFFDSVWPETWGRPPLQTQVQLACAPRYSLRDQRHRHRLV